MPDEKKQHFMHHLTIDKVSFVDKPANNREFLVFKSADAQREESNKGSDKMTEALKKVLKAQGLSDEEVEKMAKAMEGEGAKKELAAALKAAKDDPEGDPNKEPNKPKEPAQEPTKKSVVDPSDPVAVELAQLRKSNEDLKKEVEAEKEIRKNEEFLVKAAKLDHVPIEKAELVKLMRFVDNHDPEQFKVLEKFLNSVNTVIRKSDLLGNISREGASKHVGGESVDSRLMKMARELVQKSSDGLTLDQAMDKVISENPELYDEHRSGFVAARGLDQQTVQ